MLEITKVVSRLVQYRYGEKAHFVKTEGPVNPLIRYVNLFQLYTIFESPQVRYSITIEMPCKKKKTLLQLTIVQKSNKYSYLKKELTIYEVSVIALDFQCIQFHCFVDTIG